MPKAKSKAIKIKKWLASGEFRGDGKNINEVIEEAGGILDDNEAGEIFGSPVFLGADGNYYSVFVEAHVRKVDKEFVDQVLEDEDD